MSIFCASFVELSDHATYTTCVGGVFVYSLHGEDVPELLFQN